MSSQHSIAALTYVLKERLQQAFGPETEIDASVEVGPPLSPDETLTRSVVRLYLHQVSANPSLRAHVEAMEVDGRILRGAPVLALDLHYLISFHGVSADGSADYAGPQPPDYMAQRMLGHVMGTFHREPRLTGADVAKYLNDGPSWARVSRIDEQLALLLLEHEQTDTEQISKVWSVLLQTQYSLSVFYRASVVLMETATSPRPAAPVGERGIYTTHPTFPRLQGIRPSQALVNDTVTLEGDGLEGPEVTVLLQGEPLVPTSVTAASVSFAVPATARAGVVSVAVVHTFAFGGSAGDPDRTVVVGRSNELGVVVTPRVTQASVVGGELVVDVEPAVHAVQTLILHLAPPDGQLLRALRMTIAITGDTASSFTVPVVELPEAPEAADAGYLPVDRRIAVEVDGVRSTLLPAPVLQR